MNFLYPCPSMKWEANRVFNSLKELIELGVSLLNQILAGPFSVVGKALYMILSDIPWRCIRVMKDSKWSNGPCFRRSFPPVAYETSAVGGKNVVKGELVRWTKLSRSLDTRPLRAFIIRSICSLIIYISATMWGGAMSMMDGRFMFGRFGLLGALLPSDPSWYLLSVLVPSWSFSWVLCPEFLWHSCTSRSWLCLVRRSTAAVRVWTCPSRAMVCGLSPWTLLMVAIKWVSTIQVYVWEAIIWLIFLPHR